LILVTIGIIIGVLYGIMWKDDDQVQASIVSPPTTLAPTMTVSPTAPPTILAWEDAGNIDNVAGEMLALSTEGKRIAVVDSTSNTTIRVHQQEEIDGTWVQFGTTIDVSFPVNSLSLAGTRLAVGSIVGNETSALEFAVDSWTLVANPITLEGWTVVLSQDGSVLAVEVSIRSKCIHGMQPMVVGLKKAAPSLLQRLESQSSKCIFSLSHERRRKHIDRGPFCVYLRLEFQRMECITHSSIQQSTQHASFGLVVAIAQPQSNVNGLNSGKVSVFRNAGDSWKPEGDDIIGDGQIQGFWGWSHSLSGNATRIAIMNNPDEGGTNQASVFYLQGSRWISLLEQMPSAMSNGTIIMSEDGPRAAVGGEELTVRVYDIEGM
jgi:hypothetical protein